MNEHELEAVSNMFYRDRFTCFTCGGRAENPQRAHFLSQGKRSRKIYPHAVIDHPANWATTCSLTCNNAVQIDHDPLAAIKIDSIINSELTDEEKIDECRDVIRQIINRRKGKIS